MKKLSINISPHIFSPVDTRYMMKGVFLALIPAVGASIFFFRMQAISLLIVSAFGATLTELVLQKLRGRKVRINDYSAFLTGVLLALVLPPSLPLWMAFLGSVFAVALGKEVFGGLGCNIFNPALLARAFLMATFPVHLTTWSNPVGVDTVTAATPLALAKFEHIIAPYLNLIEGNVSGSLGETSAIALLIGLVFLLRKKIIDHRIPAAFIGTVAVFSTITHLVAPGTFSSPIANVLSGGLLLGAIFMATDPVTSPVTVKGRWIFGIGCGLITMLIRIWGGLPEGVMYSILLMNALTPLINRASRPKRFGVANAR